MQTVDRASETKLYRCNWAVAALAGLIAVAFIVASGIPVDVASALTIGPVIGFLVILHVVYTARRPDPIISNISAALAIMMWCAAVGGVVSLTGLSLRAPLIDEALARADALLGFNAPRLTAEVSANTAAGQIFGFAYLSSFPLIFILTVYLGVTRRFRALGELCFAFSATIVVCAVFATAYPAIGAFAHYALPATVLDGLPPGAGVYHLEKFEAFRSIPLPVLSFAELQGVVTFPSFHTCLALMTAYACRGTRFLLPSCLWNGIVIISTIPIGGHYVIDLFAGAALWMCVTAMAAWPNHAGYRLTKLSGSSVTTAAN